MSYTCITEGYMIKILEEMGSSLTVKNLKTFGIYDFMFDYTNEVLNHEEKIEEDTPNGR